jgi:IS5 family transposase
LWSISFGIYTALANMNEIANPEAVLATADLPEHTHLYGDKGYRSDNNEELLKRKKLKSSILHKAKKGQPLTAREKLRNRLIGKTRFKVERTFGGITRWFNSTGARYRGILKMHTQNLMEAIAYNLYRSPGIVASKPIITAK